MLPEHSERPTARRPVSPALARVAHLGLVRAAPHGLHELLHLLSLVQRVPQRVFRAHELVLQPLELGRRGRVNEGVAPLVRQGLLFVLDAAGETKSMRVSVSARACTCARVCWDREVSPPGPPSGPPRLWVRPSSLTLGSPQKYLGGSPALNSQAGSRFPFSKS